MFWRRSSVFISTHLAHLSSKPLFTTMRQLSVKQSNPLSSHQIFVDRLLISARIGKTYWNVLNEAALPYKLSVILDLNNSILQKSGAADDLNYSISYADVSNYILEYLSGRQTFQDSNEFLAVISDQLINGNEKISNLNANFCRSLRLVLDDKHCHLKLKNLQISKTFSLVENSGSHGGYIVFDELKLLTKIGIFDFERKKKQYVSINLKLDLDEILKKCSNLNDFLTNELLETLSVYVEETEFLTIEALIISVKDFLSERFGIFHVYHLQISKLNAVLNAEQVGLQIVNNQVSDSIVEAPIKQIIHNNEQFHLVVDEKSHTVFLAFGTNHGDLIANIYQMMDALCLNTEIEILATSSLYETAPMYYLDQSNFINGALKIKTTLSPIDLLRYIKDIEYKKLNRVKEFDNGPRTIDLDIILYDDIIYNNLEQSKTEEALVIPHVRMLERLFVLDPLLEILQPYEDIHPVTNRSITSHCKELQAVSKKQLIKSIIPLTRRFSNVHKYEKWGFSFKNDKTLIMGIINMTKNSFSDGGVNYDLNTAFQNVKQLIHQGADIIDIGATSTKPGVDINASNADLEIEMLVPLIRKIRADPDPKINTVLISVDTFFSKTARETILQGADIINDISMGLYDEEIYKVVRDLQVPYIMNHTRGTPQNMTKLTDYAVNKDTNIVEFNKGVNVNLLANELEEDLEEIHFINAVSKELAISIGRAMKAGIKKWQIILDPGIGFAKTLGQNLTIVRHSNYFRHYSVLFKNMENVKTYNETHGLDYSINNNKIVTNDSNYLSFKNLPILLGPSRKRFISKITKEELDLTKNEKTIIGTSGVIMACIKNKTNIVRVHDVQEIKKICLLGDAIYNNIA